MRNIVKFILKSPKKVFCKVYNYIVFTVYKVCIGENWDIRGRLFVRNHGKIIIGKNFTANCNMQSNPVGGPYQTAFAVSRNAVLNIGDDVGISGTSIMCNKGITIGNNVKIGSGCIIYDTNFHSMDYLCRRDASTDKPKESEVVIGNDVFIGARSVILQGVNIGNGAVIGAGSVVRRNVPEGEIWAGNPAVCVKKIITNQNNRE